MRADFYDILNHLKEKNEDKSTVILLGEKYTNVIDVEIIEDNTHSISSKIKDITKGIIKKYIKKR